MSTSSARAAFAGSLPVLVSAGLWFAALSAWAHGTSTEVDAASLYVQHCSVCHGENGDGRSLARSGLRPPPRDFTAADSAAVLTAEHVGRVIRDGKPGTAMVGWAKQLRGEEIRALADYIVETFVPATANPSGTGERVYRDTCSVCHGEDGRGARWGRQSLDPPPVNFARADPRRLTRERMIRSVTHGRPGTAMTAFGTRLRQAEIAETVDYIRGAFMRPLGAAGSPGARRAATTVGMAILHGDTSTESAASHDHATHGHGHGSSEQWVGDIARGKVMYEENCAACHGENGDGRGPRAYFIFPKPRNFRDPRHRSTFDRANLIASITHGVTGREMPAWGKVLSAQQIADIAEYVYSGFITGAGGPPAGHNDS